MMENRVRTKDTLAQYQFFSRGLHIKKLPSGSCPSCLTLINSPERQLYCRQTERERQTDWGSGGGSYKPRPNTQQCDYVMYAFHSRVQCATLVLTVINLNRLFLIPEVQLCGQWLHMTALFVIAQLIFKWKKKLVSFTVSQDKLSFEWELPFQYLEVYKMHLENLLLWKMKRA